MRTNRYAGRCAKCGATVAAEHGVLTGPPWTTWCKAHAPGGAKPLVRFTQRGDEVAVKPDGYLGDGLFGAYRDATSSLRYDREAKAQVGTAKEAAKAWVKLNDAGFDLDVPPAIKAGFQAAADAAMGETRVADERVEEIDARLADRGLALFRFQRSGVKWLASRDAALLADDMGLGKTVQALVAAPAGAPILVIAPAVAKGVWAREVRTWRPDLGEVEVLSGRGSFRWPASGEVVVTNYDILPPADDLPGDPAVGTVLVADEAHAIKNHKAARTKKVRAISKAVRGEQGRTWLLTATPMLNRPPELWSLLQCLKLTREVFGGYRSYVRLMGGREGRFGLEWDGAIDPSVPSRLRRAMLRREKTEVLTDLPAKRVVTVEVNGLDKKTRKLCDAVLDAIKARGMTLEQAVERAASGGGLPGFEEMSRARAALATAKIPAVLGLVEEFEESGEPLVVFSAHRAPIDALAAREGWAAITGDTKPADRTAVEEAFQRGDLRGVAATIQAGGVAITLTKACNALFVDQLWSPALNSQACDRIYRIGQDRPVLVKVLTVAHPVDSRVADLLIEKQGRIDRSVNAAAVGEGAVEVEGGPEAVARAAAEAKAVERSREAAQAAQRSEKGNGRREAETAQERWAAKAVVVLAGMDGDRARERNDAGFNRVDGDFGHSLADAVVLGGMLTDRQWEAAIRLCRKYRRQVGACPE